ncbi:hypothetical protein [Actinoallomurus rhizosphaericola]|uniref:hypothetical protein n=1 Tax=Actinoallomurus rhizosphaericola TaxID=2952536 RepID=UPI00209366EA|nr:hypothetical protein [Actinoallomurus rhizosphaericola]MCO5998237.1 hypothetical protein [Actinoallomurus rhizosphaericola]
MKEPTAEEISAYARWLTQACQEAGLDAEQYGRTVLIIATDHFLSEQVTCQVDENGVLRRYWSWGKPIAHLRDATRILTTDEVDDLVAAIKNVVSIQIRRR